MKIGKLKKIAFQLPGVDFINRFRHLVTREPLHVATDAQQRQRIMVNQYRDFLSRGVTPYPNIADSGFRCYSQFDEDGIILYVLSMIGFESRKVVELCCGSGHECMATNLILNHGFKGYLFEGDPKKVQAAKDYFASKKNCELNQPTVKVAWVAKETINEVLKDAGASGEVDLLSLDIDGNDYYVWDAITEIKPRLCVLETHDIIPSGLSLTIKYDPKFYCDASIIGPEQDYRSVSLLAMKKLSERKGYRMIGAQRHGFNVFFLREDIAADRFPAVSVEQIHDNAWTQKGQTERWPAVKDMDWVEV